MKRAVRELSEIMIKFTAVDYSLMCWLHRLMETENEA